MPTTNYTTMGHSARAIGNRTNAAGTPVLDVSAEEDRLIHDILTPGALSADAFQVAAGGGGTMQVVVGSGSAKSDVYVIEGQDAGQGNYLARLDDATRTLTLDAAAGASARTDEVYLVVRDDAYDGSSRGLVDLAVRKGDAGGAAPGPDAAWSAYALLASVFIPAAASDILATTITDERIVSGLTLGTVGGIEMENHGARHGAAGDDRVMVVGAARTLMAPDPTNVTTSYADAVSFSFVPPAHWNTYDVVIWGDVELYCGGSNIGDAPVQITYKLEPRIGSSVGPYWRVEKWGNYGTVELNPAPYNWSATNLSGTSLLRCQVRYEARSLSYLLPQRGNATLNYMAVRRS